MSNPMTTYDVLVAARKLIEKPENWCKGDYAKDASGEYVNAMSDKATSFCMYGAIDHVIAAKVAKHRAEDAIRQVIPGGYVADFNDDPQRAHAEVLAAFDKAIEAERAKVSS